MLLHEAFVDIKGNMAPYRQSVVKTRKNLETNVGRMNKAVKKHQAAIRGIGVAMTALGVGITAGFVKAIRVTGDFQQAMTNTQSVASATSEELQKLTEHARRMGEKSVFSATQAANAMYSLASAGFDTEKIVKSLEGTLSLAAATQSDLAFTTGVVASTLSAFGLEASETDRIANTFAATISASQATMDKLATSMSFVGPVARSVGMSLEETTGILGSLFNAGIDASTAGTSLRQAIAKLLKPTGDAQKALDRLGVSVKDSGGNLRSFTDIVADLEAASLTAEDALTIFGIRAGPGMLALVNQGSEALDKLTKKVTGTRKAYEMAELQTQTFQGQMKMLKSAVQELQIAVGTTLLPALTDLAKKMADAVKVVSEWAREHPKLTKALAEFGIVLGGLLVTGGAMLLFAPTVLNIAASLPALSKGIGLLVVKLGALKLVAATAGVALAGIATGIGLIALATREFDKARERGRADVTGEFERNRKNIEQIRKGIEEENAKIKRVQEDIATFGPHPAYLKALNTAEKRLAVYRNNLLELQGDVFHLKMTTDDAATSTGKHATATDDATKATAALARMTEELQASLEEIDFGFLPFPELETTAQKLQDLTDKANEFRDSMDLRPIINRALGGEFALVLPGKIDLPLNALERDIEEIEQRGMTIAPVAVDMTDLKESLRLANELQNELQTISTGFLLFPELPTTEQKLKDLTETANKFRESMDLRPKVERPLGGLFALQLPGMAGTEEKRTVAPSAIVEKELQETLKLEKFYAELRKEVALKGMEDAKRRADEIAKKQKEIEEKKLVSLKKIEAEEKKAQEEAIAAWEFATSEIQGAFEDLFVNMFDEGKDSWEQFGEDIKRIMLRKFAEILAAEIFGQIGKSLAGAGGGGGGGGGGLFGALLGTGITALLAPALGPLAPLVGAAVGGLATKGVTGGGGGSTAPTTKPSSFASQFSFDVPALAAGGIINTPTAAMIGERGAEAVVPLRGGNIPVEMRGGGRSIVIENMPISFPNADINNLDETLIEKNMTTMIPFIQRAIDNGEISIK